MIERGRFAHRLPSHRTTLWDADHIVAHADGGTDALENIQTVCWWCHMRRSAEQSATWAAARLAKDALAVPVSLSDDDLAGALAVFLELRCERGESLRCPMGRFVTEFGRFCRANKIIPWTMWTIPPALHDVGIVGPTRASRGHFVGVALK